MTVLEVAAAPIELPVAEEGVRHFVCDGTLLALCGADLTGGHVCAPDGSCGCRGLCEACVEVDCQMGELCPITGAPCDCAEDPDG